MEVKLLEFIKTSLEECDLNLKLVNKLGGLLTKEGIARNFPVRSKFYWNILPPHTKKKDASQLIYRRVEKELKYLQDIKQLNKLNKRPDNKLNKHRSIQTYGTLVTNLLLIGLQVVDAYIQVTDNGLNSILGRDYLKKLGLRITQERYGKKLSGDNKKVFGRVRLERKTGKQIQRSFHEKGILKKLSSYELPRNDMEVKLPEIIKTSLEECDLNLKLVNKLGGLLTKEGIARNFPVRSKFLLKYFTATQQKERRIPINLQTSRERAEIPTRYQTT